MLLYLYDNFGGENQFRPEPPQHRQSLFIEDGIGPVTWEGGPVSKAERIKLLTSSGQYKPFSSRKSKKILGKTSKTKPKRIRKEKEKDKNESCEDDCESENESSDGK